MPCIALAQPVPQGSAACIHLPDPSGLTIAPEGRPTLIGLWESTASKILQQQAHVRCITRHARWQTDTSIYRKDGEQAGTADRWSERRSRIGRKIDLRRDLSAFGRTRYLQSWDPELCWRLWRFGPARVLAGSFVAHATARLLVPPWLMGGIEPDRHGVLRSLKPTWELQPVT